ncbi:ankyrin repeat-containing domain protein [Calycina marina]|uniref:Ankyrin repeat-containing domain protein n=1 Tax=Calycina marina TaxID=1763456 RepID=A0A9P7YUR3_9HELO|nr:ankyrin repeat-containing domain protein [Calycina marina]
MTHCFTRQSRDAEPLSKKCETPLFRAVQRDERGIVYILLDKGANPAFYPPGEHTPPLQYAAFPDRKSVVKMLIERCTLGEIEDVTPAGETALYLAVQKGYNGSVEILLKAGANINTSPLAKPSILNVAVSAGQLSVVKLLLEKGAFLEERNQVGDTPLACAVASGNTKVAKLLIEHTTVITHLLSQAKIDLEIPNSKGETPLYTAINASQTTIMQTLL